MTEKRTVPTPKRRPVAPKAGARPAVRRVAPVRNTTGEGSVAPKPVPKPAAKPVARKRPQPVVKKEVEEVVEEVTEEVIDEIEEEETVVAEVEEDVVDEEVVEEEEVEEEEIEEVEDIIEEEKTKPVTESKKPTPKPRTKKKTASSKKPKAEKTKMELNSDPTHGYRTLTLDKIIEDQEDKKQPFVKKDDVIRLLYKKLVESGEHSLDITGLTNVMRQYDTLLEEIMEKKLSFHLLGVTAKYQQMPKRLVAPNPISKNHTLTNLEADHYKYTLIRHINRPKPSENMQGSYDPETGVFTSEDGVQIELELAKSIVKSYKEL